MLRIMLQHNSFLRDSDGYSYFFQPDLKDIYLGESFDAVLKKLGLTELGIQYCRTAEKPFGITVSRSYIIRVTGDEVSAEPIVYFASIENSIYSNISFRFHENQLCVITGEFSYNWPTQVLF